MKAMYAKFAGKCKACGCQIEVGDRIVWAKGAGARCADTAACESYLDYVAEANAERAYFDRLPGGDMHNEVRGFYDDERRYDRELARDEAEYLRGYHEVAQIQASFPPGPWRDAAYAEMEMAAYNRGEDY